ncbi:hypothetical protein FOBRF1_007260 [Fusarium oxysporum]
MATQQWNPPTDMPDLKGKVAVVTGGSSGIGLETVRLLAQKGTKVYLTTRSASRARQAKEKLTKDTDIDPNNVQYLVMDLYDPVSITLAVDELKKNEAKLHILINNAAASTSSTDLVDGKYEQHMVANDVVHTVQPCCTGTCGSYCTNTGGCTKTPLAEQLNTLCHSLPIEDITKKMAPTQANAAFVWRQFIDLGRSNSKKSKRYRCRHCQKDFAATSVGRPKEHLAACEKWQAKQRQERQAQDNAGYLPSYSEAIQKKITEVGIQHISQDESHSYAYDAAAAVIAGGRPFSLFESRRWRYFFTRIKPGWKPPSRAAITRILPDFYQELYDEVFKRITSSEWFNIIFDASDNVSGHRIVNISKQLENDDEYHRALSEFTHFRMRTGGPDGLFNKHNAVYDDGFKPAMAWQCLLNQGSILARVAVKVMNTLANSVPSERSFSAISFIHTKARNRLTPMHADMQAFIFMNDRVLDRLKDQKYAHKKRWADLEEKDWLELEDSYLELFVNAQGKKVWMDGVMASTSGDFEWQGRFEAKMAEDEDREKPTKLLVLPKKEGGNLYGTYFHMGPFILINRLLPLLKTAAKDPSADVRIVNLSSTASISMLPGNFKFNFDSSTCFKDPVSSYPWQWRFLGRFMFGFDMIRYAVSKAAVVLFTQELQGRLQGQNLPITCIAVHPGEVLTEGVLAINNLVVRAIARLSFMTAEQGAANSLFAATATDIKNDAPKYKGKFLVLVGKLETPNPVAQDDRQVKGLWENTVVEVNKWLTEKKLPLLEAC